MAHPSEASNDYPICDDCGGKVVYHRKGSFIHKTTPKHKRGKWECLKCGRLYESDATYTRDGKERICD